MTTIYQAFLQLIRLGIGTSKEVAIPRNIEWASLMRSANQQGLFTIVLDGIERLSDNVRPPKELLLPWIGSLMKEETCYAIQWNSAIKMASLMKQEGIRTYVLKGNVVAECYPKPSHRRSVDFDCFLRAIEGSLDVWEKGNFIIERIGFDVKRNYYKNSTFTLPDLIVENHRWLTPFRGDKRLTKLEGLLQELLREDKCLDRFEGTELYRPPVIVSALFMVEHVYSHFLHEGLNWRHVLDWMMFSKKHQKEIDWPQFEKWIDEFGFRAFYTSYYNLGKCMLGEIEDEDLTAKDKLMLADVWAPLDLHETVDGLKGKLNLASNTWRARWKYREFTDMTWIKALWIQVKGFMFIKEPKL